MKVEKQFFNLGSNIRTSYLRPDLFPVREARHVHNILYVLGQKIFFFSRTPIMDTKSHSNAIRSLNLGEW